MQVSADAPLRQVARLRAEMFVVSMRNTRRFFPNDIALGIEFGIVSRMCIGEWTRSGEITAPREPASTITIRQIAASLGAPAETTRRRVRKLVDRGIFAASDRGITLAGDAAAEALIRDYWFGMHDQFVRLIEDMAATADLDLPVGAGTPSLGDVLERAFDAILLSLDTHRLPGTGVLGFTLWGALTAMAVRDVTYDPVLARRYAVAIPPDELRKSVSLRRFAAALGFPYATVWRLAGELRAQGLVTRLGNDRWTVLTENLLHASARAISAPPAQQTLRKVREVTLLGLDPARAADHYRIGRPPLGDLGLPAD